MHSDEYGITLSREVNICNVKLKEIRRFLAEMEEKYTLTTEAFLEGCEIANSKDAAAWKENYVALKTWSHLKEQYDEIYRDMR